MMLVIHTPSLVILRVVAYADLHHHALMLGTLTKDVPPLNLLPLTSTNWQAS